MEYKVYTYSPDRIPAAPHQRHPRRRRRYWDVSPVLRFAVLFISTVLALLILFMEPLGNMKIGTADGSLDTDPHFVFHSLSAPGQETWDSSAPPARAEYDFSCPVPASGPVENSYFDDAVFIGDSITEGFLLNTGLSNAVWYAYKGLTVDTVFTRPVIHQGGQKLPVMDALKATPFSKVYIMLGINETGWIYSQAFQAKYGEVIDGIREINPEAVIYIQEILPVSDTVSSTHSYITNAKINEYNSLLRELAEEKQVFYVDTGSAVASADGSLPENAAADGIHLVKDSCEKWLDYLKTHTTEE